MSGGPKYHRDVDETLPDNNAGYQCPSIQPQMGNEAADNSPLMGDIMNIKAVKHTWPKKG
jgi:hypothetical protein